MSRRYLIAGVVLSVTLVCSVIVPTVALAETTLLAEWLVNGSAVTALLPVEKVVEALYIDPRNGAHILCTSYIRDGSMDPSGVITWTATLTLAGTEVTLTSPLLCKAVAGCEESATDIELSPEGQPWHGLLILTEGGAFKELLFGASYFISCLVLGVKISEECTGPSAAEGGSSVSVSNVTGGVESTGPETPLANCTVGGKETGEVEFLAGNLLSSSEGTVTVSE
jgi:hypothetical protein